MRRAIMVTIVAISAFVIFPNLNNVAAEMSPADLAKESEARAVAT